MFLILMACTGDEATNDDRTASEDSAVVEDSEAAEPCAGVTPVVTDLDPDELAAMLESKDFQLINVHTPYAGEIPGTDAHVVFSDVDALEAQLVGDIGARAVLYCRTGPMSLQATQDLVERGYCGIFDLPDGMVGWERAGYTLDD